MSSSSSSSSLIDLSADDSGDENPSYQGRVFVFTVNNPEHCKPFADFGKVMDRTIAANNGLNGLTYMIWCHEIGEAGTPHLQGYMQLKKKMKIQSLKNKVKPKIKAWVQQAVKPASFNIDYISHTGAHADKPGLMGGPWTFGNVEDITTAGRRTDIEALVTSIKSGKNLKQLCSDHTGTMLKYFGNAQKISQLLSTQKRAWRTELYIYTGRAGAGKSYQAHAEGRAYLRELGLDEDVYDMPVPNKTQPVWFQGYEGQAVVIIDDFYGSIDINMMKNLCDENPMLVPVKNGHAQFLARRIYITSNVSWTNWWGADLLAANNHKEAMQRRITVEKHFTDTYEERLNNARQVTMINDEPINQHTDDDLSLLCMETLAAPPMPESGDLIRRSNNAWATDYNPIDDWL